jgi:uncharacterized membrane protein YqiK
MMDTGTIAFLVIGLVVTVVLCMVTWWIGTPCLRKKCSKMAKRGHVFCKECEKRHGIHS